MPTSVTTAGTPVIRMTIGWRVHPGEAASITSALQALMLLTRAEPGCTGCSLSAEAGTFVEIHYVTGWRSEPDLQREIRSRHFSQLAELMERATEPPSIEFTLPDGTHGVEYAEAVRQRHDAG